MKKILISILFAVSASPLFAQSAFEGFYGQVATGYEKNSYSSVNQSVSDSFSRSYSGNAHNQSSSGMPLILGFGYNLALTEKYLIGIGVDYSTLSQSTGNFSQTVTPNAGGSSFTSDNMSYKASKRMNLFVTPGYALNKYALIYAKLGYSREQLQYSQGAATGTLVTSGFTSSSNVNGYIVGLGYKQIITEGLYGFAVIHNQWLTLLKISHFSFTKSN
jgi:hypothetical protein